MSNDFMEGFDLYPAAAAWNDGTQWVRPTAGYTVTTTNARNGRTCLAMSGVPFSFVSRLRRAISDGPIKAFGFALIVTDASSIPSANVSGIGGGTLATTINFGINATGNLLVRLGGTVLYTSPLAIPLNTWTYIDAVYVKATQELAVYLNNTPLTVVTGINVATFNEFCIGGTQASNSGGWSVDDIYVNDGNERWGDIGVLVVKASANAAPQDWTAVGGTAFSTLGNTPPVAGRYIESAAVGNNSRFDMPVLPVGVFQVFNVDHVYRGSKTDAGDSSVRGSLVVGGTQYNGAANALPQTTPSYFRDQYPINPATGIAWVPADFAAVNIKTNYERTL